MFLKQLRKQALSRSGMAQHWIGRENIERFVIDQETPNQFSTYQVWSLLIFEQWIRTHAGTLENGRRPRNPLLDFSSFFRSTPQQAHQSSL